MVSISRLSGEWGISLKLFQNNKSILYKQILLVITGVIILTFIILFTANTFFLKRFYQREKTYTIENVFNELTVADEDGALYKKHFRPEFEKICTNANLSIFVMSSDRSIVLSSAGESSTARIVGQFFQSVFDNPEDKIIKQTSSYTIELQEDNDINGDFIVLWGNLPDGNMIVIRSAMESLKESAQISNKCLLVAGIFSLIISFGVTAVLTRRITKPITELSHLSKKMIDLDFEAKYHPRDKENEIDTLGKNFNEMSSHLEAVIGQLKNANAKLSRDLDVMGKNEEMRKDFLSNVSHELKTPIALIEGYAEGLRDGVVSEPEDIRYYLDVIIDESKKMDDLVQQLLALNKLEFGDREYSMSRLDLTNAVKEIVKNADILLRKNDIKVRFDNTKKVCIWGDEMCIEQIVQNYLSNAIHYAKDDKIIEINLLEKDEKVIFSVFNTGDPIPEDSLDKVWDKFYKVDKARTREYGGTGLGLSIVKAWADVYHQECKVVNKSNGVEFIFTFDKA